MKAGAGRRGEVESGEGSLSLRARRLNRSRAGDRTGFEDGTRDRSMGRGPHFLVTRAATNELRVPGPLLQALWGPREKPRGGNWSSVTKSAPDQLPSSLAVISC